MKTEFKTLVEPTVDNIEATFGGIIEWVNSKGYRIEGVLKLPTGFWGNANSPRFESKSQKKVVMHYMGKLEKEVSMATANRFLHFLFKRVYKLDAPAPRVNYSEKECKIKAARKQYKDSLEATKKLYAQYKEIKGDFYKSKLG